MVSPPQGLYLQPAPSEACVLWSRSPCQCSPRCASALSPPARYPQPSPHRNTHQSTQPLPALLHLAMCHDMAPSPPQSVSMQPSHSAASSRLLLCHQPPTSAMQARCAAATAGACMHAPGRRPENLCNFRASLCRLLAAPQASHLVTAMCWGAHPCARCQVKCLLPQPLQQEQALLPAHQHTAAPHPAAACGVLPSLLGPG